MKLLSRYFALIMAAIMADNKTKIYSVGQVNAIIKAVLEENLPSKLIIRGEISDWKPSSGGHFYPSLKDQTSILPCAMWRSSVNKLKFKPEDGMEVLATGYIDIYIPKGKYKFIIDKLEPAGTGALQLAFEQMVKRLEAEGLFAEEHKKPIPPYPMRIGILTSETGAAIHDITDSIFSRWPCAELFFYPVPVQGENAAVKIAAALGDINKRNKQLKLDVLIVGRGGGSLEDLWAFNEEILARAIFDSKIPVISAVGHEIDTTITDLVADRRASTPTHAGVAAVPDIVEVLEQLTHLEKRLSSKAAWVLELAGENLKKILASAVFRNPLLPIHNRQQQLDDMQSSLTALMKDLLTVVKDKLSAAYEQIIKIEPHRLLGKKTIDLNNMTNRIDLAMKNITGKAMLQLTAQENRLASLNPKSVLNRGYSITTSKNTGSLVKNLKDIEVGDLLLTELAGENLIESQVTKK
jgi:exodeoxyribonuclease VII large subunit